MTNKKRKKSKLEDRKYLRKDKNIKSRRDYIDTFYVDGVKNNKGEMVMRPLTDEEADWLNQYYKEAVNAISKDAVLYDPDKDFRKSDGGWIYKENNDRNNCLYNTVKKTGRLSRYNYKDFDDTFSEMIIKNDLDLEHALLVYSQLMDEDEDDDGSK